MAAGLIIKGLLSVAFLAATYFLRPSSNTTRGGNPNIPIQQSDFGVMIPIILGAARIGGNIVWSSGLRRVESVDNVGGKGGPSSSVTTYTYFVDVAVMLSSKTLINDIIRIWADSKVIFDKTGASDTTTVDWLDFRLLKGEKDQQPDSLIQTEVDDRLGAGSTPAYRGRSVVVFEDFKLEDFGNRIPNLSFEVVSDLESSSVAPQPGVVVTEGPILSGGGTNQSSAWMDWTRNIMWFGGNASRSLAFSLSSLEHLRSIDVRSSQFNTVDPETGYILSEVNTIPNQLGLRDGVTGAAIATISIGLSEWEGSNSYIHNPLNTTQTIFVGQDFTNSLIPRQYLIASPTPLIELTTTTAIDTSVTRMAPPTPSMTGTSYGLEINSSTDVMTLQGFGLGSLQAGFSALSLVTITGGTGDMQIGVLGTFTPSDFGASSFDLADVNIAVDEESNDILASFSVDGGTLKLARITSLAQVLWTIDIPFSPPARTTRNFRIIGKSMGWISSDRKIILVDIASGDISPIFDGLITVPELPATQTIQMSRAVWDEKTFSFFYTPDSGAVNETRVIKVSLSSAVDPTGGISLADVVSAICDLAGLEIIEDYDVSELVTTRVPGYTVGEQQVARTAIQPLSDIFNFDGVESDYKLRFKTRGRSSTVTITEDDMIRQNNKLVFGRTRVQESELPRSVQVITSDPANAYQIGIGQAERVLFPGPTVLSDNQLTVEAPIVLDSDRTRQAAERRLFTAWNERNGFEFRTNWGFVTQDPSDVITMTFNDGFSTEARLEEANTGSDLTLDMRGVGQGAGQYISTIAGESGSSLQVNIKVVENSQLFILDTPLLRDIDAPTSGLSRMYWAANSFGSFDWTGGVMFESEDLTTFFIQGARTSSAPWAVLTQILAPPATPWTWDNVNTIEITPQSKSDEFSSSTDDLVLAGANALALIRPGSAREIEIVQFVNAVENADSSITLSRLLRGRRGTEVFADTDHAVGTIAVLVSASFVSSFLDAAAEAGQAHLYRLVTQGQSPGEAPLVSYSPDERSLRPYAPTQQTATTNVSDIDLTAVRRTRFGGELMDGTGVVPLNEENEEYELEILNAAGDTVLRTVVGLTTPFYKYLSADITTDFGAPPATLNVVWYQVSASVGRGFPGSATVEVI